MGSLMIFIFYPETLPSFSSCSQVGVLVQISSAPSVKVETGIFCFTLFICHVTGFLSKYLHLSKFSWYFPGGTVVKNPPANAGDTGSIPGSGISHMPRSN